MPARRCRPCATPVPRAIRVRSVFLISAGMPCLFELYLIHLKLVFFGGIDNEPKALDAVAIGQFLVVIFRAVFRILEGLAFETECHLLPAVWRDRSLACLERSISGENAERNR